MATQPCPKIAQVILQFTYDAQNIQNTLYFENSGGWDTGDMLALSSAVDGVAGTDLIENYCSDVKYVGTTATDLTDLSSERHRVERTPQVAGSAVGTSGPANAALCVTFLTASRGKGQQGRIFVGPIPDSAITANLVDSTWAGNYLVDLESLIAAAVGSKAGTTHVVLSRYIGKAKRESGIGKLVTGVAPQNFYVDSQRDRLPFHKKHKRPALTP